MYLLKWAVVFLKIRFVRSGGFAGIRHSCDVDLGQLSFQEKKNLELMIEDFCLVSQEQESTQQCDVFFYEISVESVSFKKSYGLSEVSVSEKQRPLVDYFLSRLKNIYF